MLYASEVLLNENRIKKYFIENFVVFDMVMKCEENYTVYHLDLKNTFQKILEKSDILSYMNFEGSNSDCFYSFLNASRSPVSAKTISLAIYVDDFNPLANSLGPASNSYKVTSVYLKILNLNPFFQSNRSLVIPFACFYSIEAKNLANRSQIYSFIVSELNQFLDTASLIV